MEEIDFLSNQYVLVYDKIYKHPDTVEREPSATTDIYIFNVSTGELEYDSTEDQTLERPFESFQIGFFLIEKTDEGEEDDVKFIFKCQKMDYQIIITK